MGEGYPSLYIGDNRGSWNEYFTGTIDEVFFYDEALSVAQLDNIRANGVLPSSVPEPTTMLLFGTGIAGLAAVGRRRKK